MTPLAPPVPTLMYKLMIGQKIDDTLSKPNMTVLQQRNRRKDKERPSGRKPPRIKDFDSRSGSKGQLGHFIISCINFK